MNTNPKLINPAVLFVLTIVLGMWLTSLGKPYHNLLFSAHKLVSVAAVIVTWLVVRRLIQQVNVTSTAFVLIAIAALAVLALFITGALLSIEVGSYQLLKTIHVVATILSVLSVPAVIYYLLKLK